MASAPTLEATRSGGKSAVARALAAVETRDGTVRHAAFLDAARAVAAQVGVQGASMSAIADHSGVGKPTIYLRWANRRELMVAAGADLRAPVTTELTGSARDDLYASLLDDRELLVTGPESRFLREIPQELIDWRRTEQTSKFSAPVGNAGRYGTPRPSPARSSAGKRPLIVLEPADRVTHDKYGRGRAEELPAARASAL